MDTKQKKIVCSDVAPFAEEQNWHSTGRHPDYRAQVIAVSTQLHIARCRDEIENPSREQPSERSCAQRSDLDHWLSRTKIVRKANTD